ncbi:MAG: D-amino-acid transaminase [Chloroflexi bacterium]|nr:D-amino-acid transaminase [Chloroflexota bacterium]
MIAYFNGRFIPKAEISISPDDRGFLFADGAYEVIRTYTGKLFQVEAHLTRLRRSIRELEIADPGVENLCQVAEELLARNDLTHADATVYIQVTRGVAPRKHAFPDHTVPPTVYVSAAPFKPSPIKAQTGVKVILVPDFRWARCDIKSVSLTPNVLASQRAVENGAEEALFVRDGVVAEGSHSNFGAVFSGVFITHPATNYILAGITRAVVLNLCRDLGIPFQEAPIFEKDLRDAEELVLLGTTTEVMPVVQVDEWMVGAGTPGPITVKLQDAFRAYTQR